MKIIIHYIGLVVFMLMATPLYAELECKNEKLSVLTIQQLQIADLIDSSYYGKIFESHLKDRLDEAKASYKEDAEHRSLKKVFEYLKPRCLGQALNTIMQAYEEYFSEEEIEILEKSAVEGKINKPDAELVNKNDYPDIHEKYQRFLITHNEIVSEIIGQIDGDFKMLGCRAIQVAQGPTSVTKITSADPNAVTSIKYFEECKIK